MPTSTKDIAALPKNLQLTFITTAAIAFVINAIYWILLLMRTYSDGVHITPFFIWATSIIIFPVLLFSIAYAMTKQHSRLVDIFKASLLTLIGLLLQSLVTLFDQFILSPQLPFGDVRFATLRILAPSLITLGLFISFVFIIKRRTKNINKGRNVRLFILVIAGVSLIATAIANIHYAASQFTYSRNILDLVTHPATTASPALPIIFFAIAYCAIQKEKHELDRIFIATIYSLMGVMIATTTALLYMIGVWTLSIFKAYPAEPLFDIQTAFVICVSLLLYAHFIISHNRSKQTLKIAD